MAREMTAAKGSAISVRLPSDTLLLRVEVDEFMSSWGPIGGILIHRLALTPSG